jgi:hypothetical protein
MSVISTGNHPKALWPGIKAWWGRQYDEHQTEYTDLFDSGTSDMSYEELVEVTGFGLAPVKEQGAGVVYDTESQGTITRATHVAYGLGYIVTREELDDTKYEIVSKRRSAALAFAMRQTKENVGANIYNRGFNSSYTFGDAKELFATDHPSLSGSQSNELATAADLSEASLEDLCIQIMGAKNSRGLNINLMPKSLHVPRQLVFEANRIVKSTLQSGTANNDVNALRVTGQFPGGIKVNHYFTDQDAFFIRTNVPSGTGLMHLQRTPIEFTQDNDFDTSNAKAKNYERYVFSVGDWRAAYGSPGA